MTFDDLIRVVHCSFVPCFPALAKQSSCSTTLEPLGSGSEVGFASGFFETTSVSESELALLITFDNGIWPGADTARRVCQKKS